MISPRSEILQIKKWSEDVNIIMLCFEFKTKFSKKFLIMHALDYSNLSLRYLPKYMNLSQNK